MRDDSTLTMTQVLARHWLFLIHETSTTEAAFATDVREHYKTSIPAHARSVEFSSHDDAVTRMTRDAEKLKRWLTDGNSARFPVDMVESFIAAFPANRRRHLQTELAERQNMFSAEIIPIHSNGTITLGAICKEHGEAVIAIAAMLEDGLIDANDAQRVPETLQEIDEAIAALMSMRRLITEKAGGDQSLFMNNLHKAIEIIGSQAELARKIGVSPMAINQWIKRGIPAKYVLTVEQLTDHQVTRHDLRPDLYPDNAA